MSRRTANLGTGSPVSILSMDFQTEVLVEVNKAKEERVRVGQSLQSSKFGILANALSQATIDY